LSNVIDINVKCNFNCQMLYTTTSDIIAIGTGCYLNLKSSFFHSISLFRSPTRSDGGSYNVPYFAALDGADAASLAIRRSSSAAVVTAEARDANVVDGGGEQRIVAVTAMV
jgi:hypothetical protein